MLQISIFKWLLLPGYRCCDYMTFLLLFSCLVTSMHPLTILSYVYCYNVMQGIKIQYIGAPHTGDIIAAAVEDSVK